MITLYTRMVGEGGDIAGFTFGGRGFKELLPCAASNDVSPKRCLPSPPLSDHHRHWHLTGVLKNPRGGGGASVFVCAFIRDSEQVKTGVYDTFVFHGPDESSLLSAGSRYIIASCPRTPVRPRHRQPPPRGRGAVRYCCAPPLGVRVRTPHSDPRIPGSCVRIGTKYLCDIILPV